MVEYQGKRLIDYEIQALLDSGIKDIAIVGGYLYETLSAYVAQTYNITAIYKNPHFDTTNMVETLFCAREWLESCVQEKQDVIISYADIVYFADTIRKLCESRADFGIIVDKEWRRLWSKRFANPLDDAETLKISQGNIIELGKKPTSYADIQGQYIGLFKFSYRFLSKVLDFYQSLDTHAIYDGKDFKNMYMTSFLQGLIDTFANATPIEIHGNWCEIDFRSDLDIPLQGLH